MTSRKQFEIIMQFEYSDGAKPNGVLRTTVKSKSALRQQVEANREWLTTKGHREISCAIHEIGTFLHDEAIRKLAEKEI